VVAKLHLLVQDHVVYQGQRVAYNQVLGTKYHKEKDSIGYHHDKMTNISANKPILSLSFGDSREFHLRYDRGAVDDKHKADEVFVLGPGDLFILGPRTNGLMKHAVVPPEKEQVLPRGRKYGPRISLVFRNIKTVISAAQVEKEIGKSRRAKVRRAASKA
jgi:alkylated DNA repair dioxygenase AlkB